MQPVPIVKPSGGEGQVRTTRHSYQVPFYLFIIRYHCIYYQVLLHSLPGITVFLYVYRYYFSCVYQLDYKSNLFQSNGESMIDKNGNVWTCIVCGKIAADAKTKVRYFFQPLFPVNIFVEKSILLELQDIFLVQANLKRHTETHIKGIPWPCNICGKVSGSKSGLAQHKAKYHKDQEGAMVAVKVIYKYKKI